VKEIENGEPLVELRLVAPELKIVRSQTIPYCRETVARMAAVAAQALPDGYHLGVTDAWRPLKRQIMIYEFMTRCAKEAYPDRDGPALRRTVNRWVAPPGRKAPPGHCTGAAIDVVLLDSNGEIVDVSSPHGRIQGGPTFVYGLDPEAQRHRFMLYEALTGAGFSNCRDEWWHYSFGDAGWAVRMGLSECMYGLIELPEDLYREEQVIWEANIQVRENPFLDRAQ